MAVAKSGSNVLRIAGGGGVISVAGESCNDNPDGWLESGDLWMDNTYESEVEEEKSTTAINESVWGAAYGRGGSGAWRSIPLPNPDTVGPYAGDWENHGGWAGADWNGSGYSAGGDGEDLRFWSFTMFISPNMLNNVVLPAAAWMKFLDSSCGGGGNNRWVVALDGTGSVPGGGLKFGIAAGGAGSRLFDDGVNTNPDLSAFISTEFVWFCIVYDAANTTAHIYMKREGDSGVTKILERDETTVFGSELLEDGGAGWYAPGQSFAGYWDYGDCGLYTYSATQYMVLDDFKIANYWVGPPW
jgi:hypothetical protein